MASSEVAVEHGEEKFCINCCAAILDNPDDAGMHKDACPTCGLGPVCGSCVETEHEDGQCAGEDTEAES